MRIAHLLLPNASEYERKSQRIDFASLSGRHEVVVVTLDDVRGSGAEIAHVYAGEELSPADFVRFPIPYVSSMPLKTSRWSWRKPVEPRRVLTPFDLPEAVEDAWFEADGGRRTADSGTKVIGTFARKSVESLLERTLARIERFRDDVKWRLFDAPPTPVDLMAVDIWVDPAVSETDYDGFVAEALVAGLPVVATRTAVNAQRLEKGRTGSLVPVNDPNEMTHAILSALFKPEVASSKTAAARQTASKFRARQRFRVLAPLYETLVK